MGIFHCVPVSPGKSRAVVLFAGNFIPALIRKLLPAWKQHQGNMKVFDSDHVLVHLAVGENAWTPGPGVMCCLGIELL